MSKVLSAFFLLLSAALLLAAQQTAPTSSLTPNTSAAPQSAPASTQPQAAPSGQKKPMIPDTFTNLQVLPKDISKADLLNIMKGFCKERKVRCSSCHVATDDLSEADFPSDEKPTKLATREMLKTLFDTRAKYPRDATLVPASK